MKKRFKGNYLDAVPMIINEDWKYNENKLIVIDVVNRGFFNYIARRFFNRPGVSHIMLDLYGSSVWKYIDGNNTVFDTISFMQEDYPKEGQDMMVRVVLFVKKLQTCRFIEIKSE